MKEFWNFLYIKFNELPKTKTSVGHETKIGPALSPTLVKFYKQQQNHKCTTNMEKNEWPCWQHNHTHTHYTACVFGGWHIRRYTSAEIRTVDVKGKGKMLTYLF